jgi:DNA-binding NarL/FixJ family response regulator
MYRDAVTRQPRLNRSGDARPRVLLVDDHPQVLERFAAMLANDFDVAGIATDGGRALDAARRIEPDAIVLDINMPGDNGFQTIRALEQAGSRAPVVFLSISEGEEFVSEAFRRGGRGYVIKSRAASDLASALDHVLSGRMFAPSLTSLASVGKNCGHAMQLHGELSSSLDAVAALFARAFRIGDATCVTATEDVREGLDSRLRARGWDLGAPSVQRRYRVVDASDALSGFMRRGLPDSSLLANLVSELDQYRRAATDRPAACLTVFGNMAGLLSAQGNVRAAIALEKLWTGLTRDLPFLTVCGYPTSCFQDASPELWSTVCAEHTAVSHAIGL